MVKIILFTVAISILSLNPAQADVLDNLADDVCSQTKPYTYENVYSGITIAELKKLAVAPINFVEMGSNSADLGNNVTAYWPAMYQNNLTNDDHRIYRMTVQRDIYRKPDWAAEKSQSLYDLILSQHGEPHSAHFMNTEKWYIKFEPDPKIARGQDSLFVKMTQNCVAETGEGIKAHKMLSHDFKVLSRPVFNQKNAASFKKSIQNITAKCPNTMQSEYRDYLEKFLAPTASYSINHKNVVVKFDCPAYSTMSLYKNVGNTPGITAQDPRAAGLGRGR